MEIPIAVAVGAELSEVVLLKQKQDDLAAAEEELERVLSLSSDFFATSEERDATYADIQANLSAAYEKPFMKKIALAYAKVKRCTDDVAWASDSVVDTTLTPAQVKAQLKQLLEHQRTTLERKMEERLQAERAEWTKQLKELREEVATERQHRKAFQAKVKDFSDYVYLKFVHQTGNLATFPDDAKFQSQLSRIIGFAPLSKHFNLVTGCSNPMCNHTLDVKCPRIRSILEIPIYVKYKDSTRSEWKDYYYPDPEYVLPSFEADP
jgi:Asp-tRNA(Asn)/Glu-tRNA(Gln) amidotransferase C subunit